ncbi:MULTISPECIES: flagellar basal body L-ring protein FlgH [Aliagarivorans]|uniref:flagellar basal body L-ring protein FlgH n=1 Tax=Aliagarivorans TaxID=882379 RepID=UPI0004258B29|nr:MULTISPECIES: flagellar basal body L-ring protein FlgH [Aliagarivorans]
MKHMLMLALSSVLLISGCSTIADGASQVSEGAQKREDNRERQVTVSTDQRSPIPDDPFYAPVEPRPTPADIIVTGSVFNTGSSRSLYSYTPPFSLGDTITVLLQEEASATKSATTQMGRNSSYTLDPIGVPGGNLSINGKVIELDMNQEQDFDGSAGSDQSHRLNARVTVSVVDILSNGNLVVRGEKWLVINNGKEYLRFTGIVRPRDVSEQNTVNSYQVADARIEFSGTGDQADTQTQGWMSSFLNGSMWPF